MWALIHSSQLEMEEMGREREKRRGSGGKRDYLREREREEREER
jgi:hypothetical protein